MKASVVDLFCGIGGLTYGFRREGFKVVAGFDTDSRCKFAYESNNDAKFYDDDVSTLSAAAVRRLYPSNGPRVLAGCAPCQPFSLYRNGKPGRRRGERWKMLRHFSRLVKGVRPEIVTMENVPQLQNASVFQEFVKGLEAAGYWTTWYVARSVLYGVPQRRSRLVLFASRLGTIEFIPPLNSPEDAPTVRDAIGHLRRIAAGETDARDPVHRARNLSDLNRQRVKATRSGGWWNEWDSSLLLECHKKPAGSTFRTVYGRMDWDRPAPTITTQCIGLGNGQFGHPSQNRAISLREAALLQTFPMKYRFGAPKRPLSMQTTALHIGNAVPVQLGRMIARSIRRHLEFCGAF